MPTISIDHSHNQTLDSVRRSLKDLESNLARQYQLETEWTSDTTLTIERQGMSGEIIISEAEILVRVELSMMLSFLSGMVETGLRRELMTRFP